MKTEISNKKSNSIHLKNKLEGTQLFKISRFKEAIKKTAPHKHDGYFELIFISEGEGFHWIETEKFQLNAPEIYFMKPGQLHCWQFTTIPKGFVALFKEEFFDSIKENPILDLLNKMKERVRISLPEDYKPTFIFEDILLEHKQGNPYSSHIIHGYLRVLFAKLLMLSHSIDRRETSNNTLLERFQELLFTHCPELHNVNQYASLLNTTPQNLNAACRKYSNKSAGQHISDQLTLEAKRYILHTVKTSNEIADLLHFNDASYFIKFFKRREGMTPLKFRERYFQ